MLKRGRISEGWLGELYAGEDAQGRPVRFVSLADYSQAQREWVLDRVRLMNTTSVQGSIPQLGIHVIQGEPCWVGAWRDAVQLSAVLEFKHIPNTVIMATAFTVLQSLHSAKQKGICHGALNPNAIWLGIDGSVWIDGYGQSIVDAQSTAGDVYAVGSMIIEMFLGTNPFPVEETRHDQCMREIGMELQAMGLPNKLPGQILTLLHPDPSKRPGVDLLVRKWKLTRAKSILSSWVRSQFPVLQSASRPEDRIPTTSRIAPLPFPESLLVEEVSESPSVLEGDETILNPRVDMTESESEAETTQVLAPEQTDLTDEEPTEETQAIQFLDEFDHDFFDTEPTSKLVVDGLLSVDDSSIEVDTVELREEMHVPSRRTFAGVLWFFAVVCTTVGAMYITLPDVPAYPERTSWLNASVSAEEDSTTMVETDTLPLQTADSSTNERSSKNIDDPEPIEEPIVAAPVEQEQPSEKEPIVMVQVAEQQLSKSQETAPESASPPKIKKQKKSTESTQKSKVVKAQQKPPKPASKPKPKPKAQKQPPPKKNKKKSTPTESKPVPPVAAEEPTEETVEPSLPPPSGKVFKSGEVQRVRLEQNGRDVPLGSVPPGEYVVYATFAGFSEFKVTTLKVRDGGKYTIHCDATFAACTIK